MNDLIGYDEIIENSMRLIIHETLKKIEKAGLPGKHYFMVTFLTRFPGVILPKSLLEKYHDEMTIAIQYQYKSLVAEHDFFRISLSFTGKFEKLTIPYKSITSFADPSMSFALKFSIHNRPDIDNNLIDENYEEANGNSKNGKKKSDANAVDVTAKVVSLDAFRKNRDETKT